MRQVAWLVLGGHLIVFALLEWAVPTSELGKHAGEIVYARATQRQRYVVTSVQSSFALFVDDQLKVSTLDEYRYHEALVHPALALTRRPTRVLLLGGGDGLAEREILRHPAVEKVTVVVVDRALTELAASMHWLRRRSQAAIVSPRVAVVEAEPIVWLGQCQDEFDVVIVDLADPLGPLEGKNYTRYFYRKLAQRLAPQGVAVVQATSPFRSPRTFAGIQQTIVAAGLQVLPYHAPIPSLGDWGFILAAHQPLAPPPPPPAGLSFLSMEMQKQLFLMPADATSAETAVASTLHNPAVVEAFARELASAR